MSMYIVGFLSGAFIMTIVICYLKGAVNAVYEIYTKGKEASDDPLTWTCGLIMICTFILWGGLMMFAQDAGWYENPAQNINFVILSMSISWIICQLIINAIVRLWVKFEKPDAKFLHIIGLKLKSM